MTLQNEKLNLADLVRMLYFLAWKCNSQLFVYASPSVLRLLDFRREGKQDHKLTESAEPPAHHQRIFEGITAPIGVHKVDITPRTPNHSHDCRICSFHRRNEIRVRSVLDSHSSSLLVFAAAANGNEQSRQQPIIR